ncbi:MAG: hypothetical protein L3K15_06405 [Thermoplasmata archaeon]|nr:hypothetical protein [Thermoplasmata archaeon]
MGDGLCSTCGGPLENGFVSTSNGSGLFWSHAAVTTRLRPKDLEVLVPTGFMGTYSANVAGERCRHCKTILLRLK